ncbi:MAG: hypothetical protein Q8R76_06780 [Candidatus Omnitrophota bacterium]|nr:hypothetical protein [Candidatus Omnitrophota bacterium]
MRRPILLSLFALMAVSCLSGVRGYAGDVAPELLRLKERQESVLRALKERTREVEKKFPYVVKANEKLFERIRESQDILENSLLALGAENAMESFQYQADFFSEAANIFVEGINFIKDTDDEHSPPIGTFLDKKGKQVRYPREKKMLLGETPFYEAQSFEEADLITLSAKDKGLSEPEKDSYLEALEAQFDKLFQSKEKGDLEFVGAGDDQPAGNMAILKKETSASIAGQGSDHSGSENEAGGFELTEGEQKGNAGRGAGANLGGAFVPEAGGGGFKGERSDGDSDDGGKGETKAKVATASLLSTDKKAAAGNAGSGSGSGSGGGGGSGDVAGGGADDGAGKGDNNEVVLTAGGGLGKVRLGSAGDGIVPAHSGDDSGMGAAAVPGAAGMAGETSGDGSGSGSGSGEAAGAGASDGAGSGAGASAGAGSGAGQNESGDGFAKSDAAGAGASDGVGSGAGASAGAGSGAGQNESGDGIAKSDAASAGASSGDGAGAGSGSGEAAGAGASDGVGTGAGASAGAGSGAGQAESGDGIAKSDAASAGASSGDGAGDASGSGKGAGDGSGDGAGGAGQDKSGDGRSKSDTASAGAGAGDGSGAGSDGYADAEINGLAESSGDSSKNASAGTADGLGSSAGNTDGDGVGARSAALGAGDGIGSGLAGGGADGFDETDAGDATPGHASGASTGQSSGGVSGGMGSDGQTEAGAGSGASGAAAGAGQQGSGQSQSGAEQSGVSGAAAGQGSGGSGSPAGSGNADAATDNGSSAGTQGPSGSAGSAQSSSPDAKEAQLTEARQKLKPQEAEQEDDILQQEQTVEMIRDWLLQERLLIQEIKRFKPVKQENNPNPEWEYYLLRQKQLLVQLKQLRRRIEFLGKKDEYFVDLRKVSHIANRLLELMNRGEYTEYRAGAKVYEDLMDAMETIEPAHDAKDAELKSYRSSSDEEVPEAYRTMVARYFKLLSEE